MMHSIDGSDNWYETLPPDTLPEMDLGHLYFIFCRYETSFQGSMRLYEECEGHQMVNFRPENKYEDVAQIFRNDIPYNNIILDSPVTLIDSSEDDKVKVITEQGVEHVADIVIVTVSLGVLKEQALDMFNPKLPEVSFQCIVLFACDWSNLPGQTRSHQSDWLWDSRQDLPRIRCNLVAPRSGRRFATLQK